MDYFCFFLLYFSSGRVRTGNGERRYFCGQKEPFAFLVSGSYALVMLRGRYYDRTALKAFYAVINNGEFTVGVIE